MSMTVIGPEANRVQADSVRVMQPVMGMSEPEMFELASKILVVIPHRPDEGIHSGLAINNGYWARMGMGVAHVADQFGGFIEFTRAGLARQFLEYTRDRPSVEYCVMIDNDESVEWDAPLKLAQWGKDLVSGVVCSFSPRKGGVFACFTVQDKFGVARFPSTKNTRHMPAQGLIKAWTVGTGLLCVHKRVFEKMFAEKDYPFQIPDDIRKHCAATGSLKLGEDMAFSEQARRHGFEIYVDLSVHAKHYKTLEVAWPQEGKNPTLDSREWCVSDEDYHHQ
jgi:hypothetical protein